MAIRLHTRTEDYYLPMEVSSAAYTQASNLSRARAGEVIDAEFKQTQ